MAETRLYFTASIEEQWSALAGPWLREQAREAWKNPRPTVVLTPSRAESFYLRGRLVQEGVTFLGLRFWTPSDARKYLLAELHPEIETARQAELRLVARVVAETQLKNASPTAQPTLSSVVQEPESFLRAYDLLLGAGWDPAQTGVAYGRALGKKMERELQELGIATQAGIHRHLRTMGTERSTIANLFVLGFNAAHWPLWDLLLATVSSSEQAVLALSEPRVFGEEVDQLWISSWEEVTVTESISPMGPVSPISIDVATAPFASLIDSYEKGVQGRAEVADLTFLVSPDLASQARDVVLQAVDYLKRDSCARLGIVFPEANALALEVVTHLRQLGILLDDGTGMIQPGIFEQRAWLSWIALQEEPSVQRLVAWLRACEAQCLPCGLNLPAHDAANILDQALGETLVDDLAFLACHLEESTMGNRAGAVSDFLRKRVALPETATFAKFLALTRRALDGIGWEEHLAKLKIDPPDWLWQSDWLLSRRTFLGWLKESTDSRERTRGTNGNHFYGKVHLLIYAQMTGQTWSHLILTGLNEGVWPRVFETEAFGSRHELAALNQQARELNRLGTVQGGQGMGHETVRAGRGHCLLPLERMNLALRDLCAALEGTSEAACLTAMTTEAGRSLLPSDFFNHCYHAATGTALDEGTFRALANATSAWCGKHEHLLESPASADKISPGSDATRLAYDARRDATRPFGPYEFAFGEPPALPIQLSCKKWEEAWNHPSTVWLEKVVGVAPWPEGILSWPRAVGTWVHRWLTISLRGCQEQNSVDNFFALLEMAADNEAIRVRNRTQAAGLELYPWWGQVWGQAKSIARGLGETLAPHLRDKHYLSEFRLPKDLLVALPGSSQSDFALTGRIDLLVIEPGTTPCDPLKGDFSGCTCWVIDFKTGTAQNLNDKKIGKGIGLQTVLYALAARARGAGPTAISLHTFDAPLKRQVELDDALEMMPLFRSLDTLHRTGIFGMRGDAQNEYAFSPAYPMATLFVPKNILEAKWALVHGSGQVIEEESE